MMPLNQSVMTIAPQMMSSVVREMDAIAASGIGMNQDVHLQQSHDMTSSAYGVSQLPHSNSILTTASMAYPTPLPSAESKTFTPMVPTMQPATSHPPSVSSSPAFSPPENTITSIADHSKRHRRHPSSGHHSPELRIMLQKQDFQQQQQQKMVAKEQQLYGNVQRVEPHQSRSPRGANGLKINVSDLQVRMPVSAIGSPTDSGNVYSPGPLSAPSPLGGPSAYFVERISEVSSTFQQHTLNDASQPSVPNSDIKGESIELEKPSTMSELQELSKQELIEKVMQYERQIEGSIPRRKMSLKQEEPQSMQDIQLTSTVASTTIVQQEHQHQTHEIKIKQEQNDVHSHLSTIPPPSPSTSPPPPLTYISAGHEDGIVKEEKKLTSPTLATYAVKSHTNLHSVVTSQNEDDEEDELEDDEDELEDDENEGEDGAETSLKHHKESSDINSTDDTEAPQQLVCMWRDCNTPFESMAALNEHVTENHIGSGKACYSCDWQACPRMLKPFTKRHKMYNHLRTHTGERPFKCLVPGCDKKFSRPDSLTTHTKTHSNIRPYVCTVEGCTKAYYHARSLKKHELAHESKQMGGVLRGSGAASAPSDRNGESIIISNTGVVQRSHHNHPYHLDHTGGTGRPKHKRNHSQSATVAAAAAAASASMTSTSSTIATVTSVSAMSSAIYSAQQIMAPMPDSMLSTGMTPICTTSPDTSSPNSVAMVNGSTGYGQSVVGFNSSILTPSLSAHNSSTVSSLSMMSGVSMPGSEGGNLMMDSMYQNHNNLTSSDGGSQILSPSGSPGFQASVVPAATLRSPTPTNSGISIPMSMNIGMPVSGISLNHPTPVMLSNIVVPPGLTMTMIHDNSTGSGMYHMSTEQATIAPSALDSTNLTSQMPDLGYNSMPVDPQQM
ncbi:hypothetical protein BGZ76_009993 [Entomortierella beljakovae]|nr:hypothetical protein BGZ76_009993 [Entomortierella beljakovae]